MFGMGGTEIIVILIVALLFLGPDKLPGAAKTISKGIRDIKRQSRSLQQQIEGDEQIGGAIRDLKSALRGEDEPRSILPPKRDIAPPPTTNTIHAPGDLPADPDAKPADPVTQHALPAPAEKPFGWMPDTAEPPPVPMAIPKVTLPASAGEADGPAPSSKDDAELAAMV